VRDPILQPDLLQQPLRPPHVRPKKASPGEQGGQGSILQYAQRRHQVEKLKHQADAIAPKESQPPRRSASADPVHRRSPPFGRQHPARPPDAKTTTSRTHSAHPHNETPLAQSSEKIVQRRYLALPLPIDFADMMAIRSRGKSVQKNGDGAKKSEKATLPQAQRIGDALDPGLPYLPRGLGLKVPSRKRCCAIASCVRSGRHPGIEFIVVDGKEPDDEGVV